MNTTKTLLCSAYGGAEQLTFADIKLKPLAKDQAQIQVHYVGMNFPDALLLQAKYTTSFAMVRARKNQGTDSQSYSC